MKKMVIDLSDNYFVTICTCMYYSIFSMVIPLMPHILAKLPQFKFENDKYKLVEALDFQRSLNTYTLYIRLDFN